MILSNPPPFGFPPFGTKGGSAQARGVLFQQGVSMKLRFLGILTFLFISQVSQAALPPTAESMRRIKAVMESHEVYDTLGSVNWIKSITETKDGYLLKSDKCSLEVTVENGENPSGLIGPLPLVVKVGKMVCQ
jgi:hypothetical protein